MVSLPASTQLPFRASNGYATAHHRPEAPGLDDLRRPIAKAALSDQTMQELRRWMLIFQATRVENLSVNRHYWLGLLNKIQSKLGDNMVFCVFCRNNHELFEMYTSHRVRDSVGRVTCLVFHGYICPRCGARRDIAHTMKYCPLSSPAHSICNSSAYTMSIL